MEQRFSAASRPFWSWVLQFAEKARFWVEQRFSAGKRTRSRASEGNELSENPAPEGRSSLAQRFSAGERRKEDSSPGGTTEFSLPHCPCGKTPKPGKTPTPIRFSGGHDFSRKANAAESMPPSAAAVRTISPREPSTTYPSGPPTGLVSPSRLGGYKKISKRWPTRIAR